MAVGTGGPHPGAVGVVDGVLVFAVDVLLHLMTADTEGLGIGGLHGGIEAAPEENTQPEKQDQHRFRCRLDARPQRADAIFCG